MLIKLDSRFVELILLQDTALKSQLLANAPQQDREITELSVKEVDEVEVLLVKDQKKGPGGFNDCSTLGRFTFSRVGFNTDSTTAAFRCQIYNGACIGWHGGMFLMKRIGGAWQMPDSEIALIDYSL